MSEEHTHHHDHHSEAAGNILVAFILNFTFMLVELVGGIITNSIAILSDALHDLGDCISLAIDWGLEKKATKKPDKKYSYGYKRFSLLGSVFLCGVLTVSSIFVLVEAVKRLTSPQAVDAKGMLWLAIAGVVINGIAAIRMTRGHSLNQEAVFLHMMEDVLGWLGVLVVSIVMMFVELPILDPILSILISCWVLYNVYKNIRATFVIFLQAIPDGVDTIQLKADLEAIDGIESIHDLHVWTQDGETHVMTLHAITQATDYPSIKNKIIEVAKGYHIDHTTIEYEHPGDPCDDSCD